MKFGLCEDTLTEFYNYVFIMHKKGLEKVLSSIVKDNHDTVFNPLTSDKTNPLGNYVFT